MEPWLREMVIRLLFLLVGIILALVYGPAQGAEARTFPVPPVTEHTWIQQNKDYTLKMPDTPTHCCHQQHCLMLTPGQVIRVEDGYIVFPSPPFIQKEQFVAEKDTYVTEGEGEGQYWACALGGKVRCLFVPPLGF